MTVLTKYSYNMEEIWQTNLINLNCTIFCASSKWFCIFFVVITKLSRSKALTQVLNVCNLDLEFEYLKISVQSCKNKTKCASQEALDQEI